MVSDECIYIQLYFAKDDMDLYSIKLLVAKSLIVYIMLLYMIVQTIKPTYA